MSIHDYSPGGRGPRWLYGLIIAAALLSGFGQMPILSRYYITSLPLMGWSANYFHLSDLHYWSVALLMALLAWRLALSRRVLDPRWSWGPRSLWGWTLFTLLFVSGAFKAACNLGIFLSPPLLMALDFVHLGSAMALMFTGLMALIRGRKDPALADV